MLEPQRLAGQRRGHQDDEQRPEIGDEARLCGRGGAQSGEIERVIAEQPADADEPNRPGLRQRRELAARGGVDQAGGPAHSEGERREFERRNGPRGGRHQRQHRPQKDRAEADQSRFVSLPHLAALSSAEAQGQAGVARAAPSVIASEAKQPSPP